MMTGEELQRHQAIVAAILNHIDSMSREELIEWLGWQSDEPGTDVGEVNTASLQHVNGNGVHPRNASVRKQRVSQAA
jgi:hypothetical protein